MERFSLFDILSVLLPGAVLLFFLNALKAILAIDFDLDLVDLKNVSEFGFGLSMSLMLGALLNLITNSLKNNKLFVKYLKIYEPIGKIMYSIKKPEEYFFKSLNIQSTYILKEAIFFNAERFAALPKKEKEKFMGLQNKFYSLAYYELQYAGKIDYPKTYQSFYFFFRQLVTASLLMIIISATILWKLALANGIVIIGCCVTLGITNVLLARFFRSEMVKKLYIIYSIHLNNKIS